jgi:hypothetical protein
MISIRRCRKEGETIPQLLRSPSSYDHPAPTINQVTRSPSLHDHPASTIGNIHAHAIRFRQRRKRFQRRATIGKHRVASKPLALFSQSLTEPTNAEDLPPCDAIASNSSLEKGVDRFGALRPYASGALHYTQRQGVHSHRGRRHSAIDIIGIVSVLPKTTQTIDTQLGQRPAML